MIIIQLFNNKINKNNKNNCHEEITKLILYGYKIF